MDGVSHNPCVFPITLTLMTKFDYFGAKISLFRHHLVKNSTFGRVLGPAHSGIYPAVAPRSSSVVTANRWLRPLKAANAVWGET